MDGLTYLFVLLLWFTFVVTMARKFIAALSSGSFMCMVLTFLFGLAVLAQDTGLHTIETGDHGVVRRLHGDWCARVQLQWYTTNITLTNGAHTIYASAMCGAPFTIDSALLDALWKPARAAAVAAGHTDDSHGWKSSAHTHSEGGTSTFTLDSPMLTDSQLMEALKTLRAAAKTTPCEWVHGSLAPHDHYVLHYTTPVCPAFGLPGWVYALWVLVWIVAAPPKNEPLTAIHLLCFAIVYFERTR